MVSTKVFLFCFFSFFKRERERKPVQKRVHKIERDLQLGRSCNNVRIVVLSENMLCYAMRLSFFLFMIFNFFYAVFLISVNIFLCRV